MRVIYPSTADLLGTELARARAALQEIHPNAASFVTPAEDASSSSGAMTASKKHLIEHIHDFQYGARCLTPKELGLVAAKAEPCEQEDPVSGLQQLPQDAVPPLNQLSLLEMLLANNIILDNLAPYLSPASLLSLASASRAMRSVILQTPYVFRHLDLTQCRGAILSKATPLDQVFDPPGPLCGIFSRLEQTGILRDVRTLILDGLSVPSRVIAEILLVDSFNVNILSIRECPHLDEATLMQTLEQAVRPDRPKGMPRVKGIYHFTAKNANRKPQCRNETSRKQWWKSRLSLPSSTSALTANQETRVTSHDLLSEWYKPSGKVFKAPIKDGWADILQQCEGIIAFDAVLCRGPQHNVDASSRSERDENPTAERSLGPAIATIALGPRGCEACHSSPESPAIWGQSPETHFPLLVPPPLHSSKVTSARRPVCGEDGKTVLIARCADCLLNRWCNRCNRWFCSTCLPHPQGVARAPHPQLILSKVPDPRISTDCWACGPTCASCKAEVYRTCERCQGGYCTEHNEGCSSTNCDWCNVGSQCLIRRFY